MKRLIILVIFIVILVSCGGQESEEATLILKNGQIYTVEEGQPTATAVVIKGNKILAVLDSDEVAMKYAGENTEVIDLEGKFALPGFIDSHAHFASYSAQQHDIQLMNVNDDEGLRAELIRVVKNVGENEWIVGGDWSGAILWSESTGETGVDEDASRWEPQRAAIDDITELNPCLLNSYDGELYLANTAALVAAGLENGGLEGMQMGEDGKPTGLIFKDSPAIKKSRELSNQNLKKGFSTNIAWV